MRKRVLPICLVCVFFLSAGCSAANSPSGNLSRLTAKRKTTYQFYNTVCFISIYDDFSGAAGEKAGERLDAVWTDVIALLESLDRAANLSRPDSDLSRFNALRGGESIPVGPVTAELIKVSRSAWEFTDGYFNPAVARLVDLWGFSPRFSKKAGTAGAPEPAMPYDRPVNPDGSIPLPDSRHVHAFMSLSDFSAVKLEGNDKDGWHLRKDCPDAVVDGVAYPLEIDLGGIAKGWGVARIGEILRRHGYRYGYANLGMSSMQLSRKPYSDTGAPGRQQWGVQVSIPPDESLAGKTAGSQPNADSESPEDESLRIFTRDEGLSTSGSYDRRYVLDGREYSHLIDAVTGEPVQSDLASVTVIGPDAALADAISTALCVMGSGRATYFMRSKLKDWKVAMFRRSAPGERLITNIPTRGYR